MRLGRVVRLAAVAAVFGLPVAAVRPQDDGVRAIYWPRRDFGFPIPAESLAGMENKPSELRLYASQDRRPFQVVKTLPADKLDSLAAGKTGILFQADRDGEYEFALQLVYPDKSVNPPTNDLRPERRVVIDTRPPEIRVAASGLRVDWEAADDNLDPASVRVECKWSDEAKWYPAAKRDLRPADGITWTPWPQKGRGLDVRVTAKDLAGHQTDSRVVRLPSTGGDLLTGNTGRAGSERPDPFATPSGGGGFAQPEIRYVNTLNTTVEYTIAKMGRSGVKTVHLWASKDQRTWEKYKTFDVNRPFDPDKPTLNLSLPYAAEKEGLYGFIIIPESGAGIKAPDPKRDDPPMVLVSVDTQPPYARITGVQVAPGAKGPRVEITWQATDINLLARPVNIEYATDKNSPNWQPVTLQTENNLTRDTGRYVWEIADDRLWKFYLRLRVVDKATNTGEHVWGVADPFANREKGGVANPPAEWKEVIVDLVEPRAEIKDVRPDGAPGSPAAPGAPRPPAPGTPPKTANPPKKGTGPAVPSLDDM